MHAERIKFDRVFDIQRRTRARSSRPFTEFSFEHGGRKRYAVLVPGWPRLVPGDVLTVVLKKKGNWQTVSGWKNHTTGQLVLPPVRDALWSIAQTATGIGAGLFNYLIAETPTVRAFAGSVALLCIFMTIAQVRRWREMKRYAKAIEHLDDAA